MYNPRGS